MLTRAQLPGLAATVVAVGLSMVAAEAIGLSSLVWGVVLGALLVNLAGPVRVPIEPLEAGFTYAAKKLLRVGIVLLGFRLSFDEVRSLGLDGATAVVVVVLATFFGVQLLARVMGLPSGLGLLVATGYSICGASAVAAMQPLSDADEEETAYAIGLVTLCGSLSIVVLPALGHWMDLSVETFGTWVGAGVHDVGQVTATASAYDEESLATATLVKLTRVVLLAPMVALVGLSVRRRAKASVTASGEQADVQLPPIIPLFVALFIGAIALRATGWLTDDQLGWIKDAEKIFLTAGMFGLGAGVRFVRLRCLGGRPLLLGVGSWVVVAGLALVAALVTT